MITVEVDPATSVAILKPQGLLTENDLETVKGIVDPYIDEQGKLAGIIVQARRFPNWESFEKLASQLCFADNQHREVARVAVVSDSAVPQVKKLLGDHFTNAQIETFPFQDFEKARRWASLPARQPRH